MSRPGRADTKEKLVISECTPGVFHLNLSVDATPVATMKLPIVSILETEPLYGACIIASLSTR
jgi:hypothetical protein